MTWQVGHALNTSTESTTRLPDQMPERLGCQRRPQLPELLSISSINGCEHVATAEDATAAFWAEQRHQQENTPLLLLFTSLPLQASLNILSVASLTDAAAASLPLLTCLTHHYPCEARRQPGPSQRWRGAGIMGNVSRHMSKVQPVSWKSCVWCDSGLPALNAPPSPPSPLPPPTPQLHPAEKKLPAAAGRRQQEGSSAVLCWDKCFSSCSRPSVHSYCPHNESRRLRSVSEDGDGGRRLWSCTQTPAEKPVSRAPFLNQPHKHAWNISTPRQDVAISSNWLIRCTCAHRQCALNGSQIREEGQ